MQSVGGKRKREEDDGQRVVKAKKQKTREREPGEDEAAQKARMKLFQQLPGVGKSIAGDLIRLGCRSLEQLGREDPQRLYDLMCNMDGPTDRCVLYVFRCATWLCFMAKRDFRDAAPHLPPIHEAFLTAPATPKQERVRAWNSRRDSSSSSSSDGREQKEGAAILGSDEDDDDDDDDGAKTACATIKCSCHRGPSPYCKRLRLWWNWKDTVLDDRQIAYLAAVKCKDD